VGLLPSAARKESNGEYPRQTKRTHFTLFFQRLVKNETHLQPLLRRLFPFYDTPNPPGDQNTPPGDRPLAFPARREVQKRRGWGLIDTESLVFDAF
jgi:hypothetical protein